MAACAPMCEYACRRAAAWSLGILESGLVCAYAYLLPGAHAHGACLQVGGAMVAWALSVLEEHAFLQAYIHI